MGGNQQSLGSDSESNKSSSLEEENIDRKAAETGHNFQFLVS